MTTIARQRLLQKATHSMPVPSLAKLCLFDLPALRFLFSRTSMAANTITNEPARSQYTESSRLFCHRRWKERLRPKFVSKRALRQREDSRPLHIGFKPCHEISSESRRIGVRPNGCLTLQNFPKPNQYRGFGNRITTLDFETGGIVESPDDRVKTGN